MTTDIKELMQTLKSAASREMVARDLGESTDIWDENVTPENVSALIEALEAKDADAEWMRKRIAELAKERETKEEQRANWFQMAQKLGEDLDAAEKRIAELEKSELQLIDERDIAEDALGDMYQAATGERPEWSSAFGISDAVDAVEQRLGELESRTVTPVTYSENADADHCRKWAWEQVKGEVSTEEWTTGDNITYFGFFCWGWDMRRQYNEQRPVTVKLPRPGFITISGERMAVYMMGEIVTALLCAGIKWEAE